MPQRIRVEVEPAYVLHHRPYRESSLLLEVLTPDHGRVGLVANGARRPKSAHRGLLQPFRSLLLSWSVRGDLGTLTAAEARLEGPRLGASRLKSGFYVNELIYRVVQRNDHHPGLFEAYDAALIGLEREPAVEPALRIFEKRLLDAIGYGLLLDSEAERSQGVEPDRLYAYDLQRGPVSVEHQVREYDKRPLLRGCTLLALARERLEDETQLAEAKVLMRAALTLYLGPKPLVSREMFRGPGRNAAHYEPR